MGAVGLPGEPMQWAAPDPEHGERWANAMGPIDHTMMWCGLDDDFEYEFDTPGRRAAGLSKQARHALWAEVQSREEQHRLAAWRGSLNREREALRQARQRQRDRERRARRGKPQAARPHTPVRKRTASRGWRWSQWSAFLYAVMLLGLVHSTLGAPLGGGRISRLLEAKGVNSSTGRLPYDFGREARVNTAYGFGYRPALHQGGEAATVADYSGIDDYDINAEARGLGPPSGRTERVHTVTGFLPEGAAVTPAESRYTVDPVTEMPMGDHPTATAEAKQAMRELCHKYKDRAFSYSINDLPGYKGSEVSLKVISDQAAFQRARWQSALQKEITTQKCTEMLEAGIIEPAPESNYASAVVVAAKKGPDGQWTDKRFCVDLRLINTITAPQHTYVPVAEELFLLLEPKGARHGPDLRVAGCTAVEDILGGSTVEMLSASLSALASHGYMLKRQCSDSHG